MIRRSVWTSTGETRFAFSAATSVGTVRAVNEDSFIAEPPVFLVADGMGGHRRGDAASSAAVDAFRRRLVGTQPWTPDAVLQTIQLAHDQISALGAEDEIAGTTLAGVVLVITGASSADVDETTAELGVSAESTESRYRWMVVNVGDSRVYLLDDDGFRQLTVDHSIVQELVDQGVIAESEASGHPERNVITRALGVEGHADPDVLLLPAEGTYTFLVCSDGVCGAVAFAELESAMRGVDEDRAEAIVALAMRSGSRDNITAIVLEATVGLVQGAAHADIVDETQPRGEVLT